MKRFGKIRFSFQMAGVAHLRLRRLKQLPLHFRVVHRMAINATYVVLEVLRAQEVGVFFPKFVTSKTPFGRLLARQSDKTDDLFWIGRLGVSLAWPVAAFASLPLHSMLVMQCLPVRSIIEGLADVFMAGFTSICPDIL